MKQYIVGFFVGGLAVTGASIVWMSLLNQSAQEYAPTATAVRVPTVSDVERPIPEVTDYRDLPVVAAQLTPVVTGLDAPWGFVWLPTGDLLVTERFGDLRLIRDGVASEPLAGIPTVLSEGQGGLLDVTIHPNFLENNFIYLSFVVGTTEENRLQIARATLRENTLIDLEIIFEVADTKSGTQHFGSRFAWLPDGTLLFSVGDGGNPPVSFAGSLIREQAQSLATHFGSVLRIADDGSIPDDNPFVGRPDALPEIYSVGHRNIQGIVYDAVHQRVLASEHGSKGGDELNVISAGQNYGWPLATFATEYDVLSTAIAPSTTYPGTKNPIVVWTPTVAPSTVAVLTEDIYDKANLGDVFTAGMLLRSNATIAAYASRPAGSVFQVQTGEGGEVIGQRRITVGDVRVRSVGIGPDGYVYVLTDTTSRQTRPGEFAGAVQRIDQW